MSNHEDLKHHSVRPVYYSDSAWAVAHAFRRAQTQSSQAPSRSSASTQPQTAAGPSNAPPSEAGPAHLSNDPAPVAPANPTTPMQPKAESPQLTKLPQPERKTPVRKESVCHASDQQFCGSRLSATPRNEPFELFPVAPVGNPGPARESTRQHEHRPFSQTAEIEQAKEKSSQLLFPAMRPLDRACRAGINAMLEDARRTCGEVPEPLPAFEECHALAADQVKRVNDFLLRERLWRMERVLNGFPAYLSWGPAGAVVAEAVPRKGAPEPVDKGKEREAEGQRGKGIPNEMGGGEEIAIIGETRHREAVDDSSGPAQKRQKTGVPAPDLGDVIVLE